MLALLNRQITEFYTKRQNMCDTTQHDHHKNHEHRQRNLNFQEIAFRRKNLVKIKQQERVEHLLKKQEYNLTRKKMITKVSEAICGMIKTFVDKNLE